MSDLIVVGAGPSGLGAATALAERAPGSVRLLDRIPVPGGESGWSDPLVIELADRATRAGVVLDLGVTAIRWSAGTLLVSGPGRVGRLPAAHLFFAGGLRPGTAADARISGERPAGVLPATVAEHLLATGARLWSRVVVIGDGPWAPHIAEQVRQSGGRVVAVTEHEVGWADEQVVAAGELSVVGRRHVEALRVGATVVPCDAVILASGPLPNRNVDGALADGDAAVTFVQPLDITGVAARAASGREIATTWLARGARK